MKKLQLKIVTMVIVAIIIALAIPVNIFAAEEAEQNVEMQIVEKVTEEGTKHIIYVKGLLDADFSYAISNKSGATESELNYINSKKDEENNSIILLTNFDSNAENYIYIKQIVEGVENFITKPEGQKIDSTTIFELSKMEYIEKTTTRIPTNIIEKTEERTENEVKITTKTGGIEIIDQNDEATYEYALTKVPEETNTELDKYKTLYEYAVQLDTKYDEMDMYSRIELANNFYDLYKELEAEQTWLKVENMQVLQPLDSQNGEKYIVYLKKSGNARETEIIDAKFLESHREDVEEKIPARQETVETKRTSKLPITNDNLILFVVLAVIVIAMVIVFIRMKKLQNKGKH